MQKQIDLESSVNEFVEANLLEIRKNTEIRNKFIELLIEYYILYASKSTFENYSSELMDTAEDCLKYFDSQKGAFTHLFNSEMKKAIRRARYKEMQENKRHGGVLPKQMERLIGRIDLYARRMGLNWHERYAQEILSNKFNISIKEVEQLIYADYKAKPIRDCVRVYDGEESFLTHLQPSREKSIEDKMVDEAEFIAFVEKINAFFSGVQDRQKRLLSMLLTVKIIEACDKDLDKARNILVGKELFNEEVFDYYEKHGKLPTNRKIAEICGISEQSLSRTYKNFKEKLKVKCKLL